MVYLSGMNADRAARLVLVCVVFAILLNYPVLSISDQPGWIGGMPKLYVYFFAVWLVLILLTAIIVGRQRPRDR